MAFLYKPKANRWDTSAYKDTSIPGGTTKKRGFKPLFFVLCSFILRCRADDIRRLVGLVYDGLCPSPHHHSQSHSLRLYSTSWTINNLVVSLRYSSLNAGWADMIVIYCSGFCPSLFYMVSALLLRSSNHGCTTWKSIIGAFFLCLILLGKSFITHWIPRKY